MSGYFLTTERVELQRKVYMEGRAVPVVQTLLASRMTRDEATSIAQLLACIWPTSDLNTQDMIEQLLAIGKDYDGPRLIEPRSLIIQTSGQVVAHASVFPRTIGTADGDMTVAALGRLCTDPKYRGQKLGVAVFQAAMKIIDSGHLPFSLFQTRKPVQSFYERLGCSVVQNRILNSTSEAPAITPFWEEVIMRYPAARENWPTGDIDLRGPGY